MNSAHTILVVDRKTGEEIGTFSVHVWAPDATHSLEKAAELYFRRCIQKMARKGDKVRFIAEFIA